MRAQSIRLPICALLIFLPVALVAQTQNKAEHTEYAVVKYVTGSGGILGATSSNYFHSATAGEAVVGGTQNSNYLLVAGYWNVRIGIPTDVEADKINNLPTMFQLHQNYPNPFNPETTIQYDLPAASVVTIEIFNLVGQKIRTLVSSALQGPGELRLVWDGSDDQGAPASSGVYLYRLTICNTNQSAGRSEEVFQQTQKMLFVK